MNGIPLSDVESLQVTGLPGARPPIAYYLPHPQYSYDQQGFHGFPARKGVDELKLISHGEDDLKVDELAAFLQAWLFFGLISEFLDDPGQIDFSWWTIEVDDRGPRQILSTKPLMDALSQWQSRFQSCKDDHIEILRLSSMVNTAKSVIHAHLENSDSEIGSPESLMIGIAGETLEWAVQKVQSKLGFSTPGWMINRGFRWHETRYGDPELKWCAHDKYVLRGLLEHSPSSLHYATGIVNISHASEQQIEAHRRCTPLACSVDTRFDPAAANQHVYPNCNCQLLKPPATEIQEVMKMHFVPLLKYEERPDGTPVFAIYPSSRAKQYVVISHVWADGWGNPRENSMLACQVKKLAGLVAKFSNFRDQDVYFWIDSICIPVDNAKLKRQAIKAMFDIYSDAYATIVVSAELLRYTPDPLDYIGPAMTIATSKWMRRLWTFQEAAMSRNLYFLFADGLKDVEDLEKLYPRAAAQSVVASSARSFYTNLLRPWTLRRNADASLVCAVWRALQWRTATNRDDETLAIARIFNIHDDRFLTSPPHLRMALLLQSLSEIPSGMIFVPGERLEIPRFRWAPASWMILRHPDYPDPLAEGKASLLPAGYSTVMAQSRLTGEGLLVRYPGIRIHMPPMSLSDKCRYSRHFPTDISLNRWCTSYDDYLELDCMDGPLAEDLGSLYRRDMDLAIICCRPNLGPRPEIALLVLIIREDQNTLICRRIQRCFASIGPNDLLLHDKYAKLPEPALQFGEELSSEQLWVVD